MTYDGSVSENCLNIYHNGTIQSGARLAGGVWNGLTSDITTSVAQGIGSRNGGQDIFARRSSRRTPILFSPLHHNTLAPGNQRRLERHGDQRSPAAQILLSTRRET